MNSSVFSQIALAPADPILGLTEAFNADTNPAKVNLGVGVYQDGSGKVPILEVVREAERRWQQKEETKSYIPIDGVPAYNKLVQRLVLGENSEVMASGRALTAQALGGTGALKIGADFLKRFFSESKVYISTPSWENHRAIFEAAGFEVQTYPYYDPKTHGIEFDEMMSALKRLESQSIILLHASCHNPTGVDLSHDQWMKVVEVCRERKLIPFLDFAYQGFAVDPESDAFAVRAFAESGLQCIIANSFSKSFSLYRERVGGLTIVTADADETKRVQSQLKRVIRTNYSSPASHGAQVVALVLGDAQLRVQWLEELSTMRNRILAMRKLMVARLKEKGVERDFSFIERQCGMFSFSGLDLEMVRKLKAEKSLYIVNSGRICVAALNENNLDYICDAISEVVR
ncbi:aromatic amino acid aminotransferase [candidate division BRC1 bacterium HGW-BRC1-1]|jgi:aromatic-amino-acid transaminase|nr:MAG: aromatic amino acid aminotransferase [candidate division BRC1 bacterium HGW-BRC1-1]